jgi:hypothetical protein
VLFRNGALEQTPAVLDALDDPEWRREWSRSQCRVAAVHWQSDVGDEARFVRTQPDKRVGDLMKRSAPRRSTAMIRSKLSVE